MQGVSVTKIHSRHKGTSYFACAECWNTSVLVSIVGAFGMLPLRLLPLQYFISIALGFPFYVYISLLLQQVSSPGLSQVLFFSDVFDNWIVTHYYLCAKSSPECTESFKHSCSSGAV
jgi:hypothetical protein